MSSSLYKGVSSPQNLEYTLERPQIDQLLQKATEKPLVTVVAGAGFGKTNAVSAYIKNFVEEPVWLKLVATDNLILRFWEHLVYALSLHKAEFSLEFSIIGFPETDVLFNAVLQGIVNEIEKKGEMLIVLDDFYQIHEPSILRFVEKLVDANIQGLTLILISRTDPAINTAGLISKNLLTQITQDDLCFQKEEITKYFAMRNIAFSEKALEELCRVSDGWIFAIYLIGLTLEQGKRYQEIPMLAMKLDVFKIMEAELFSNASAEIQDILITLSFLDYMPTMLLRELCMGIDSMLLMQELEKANAFIRFDSFSNSYQMHNLFHEFLQSKQMQFSQEKQNQIHKRVAEWYFQNNFKIEAVAHYEKAGCYTELIRTLSTFVFCTYEIAALALEYLDRIPTHLYDEMPIAHTIRAGFLTMLFRIDEANAQLYWVKERYEKLPLGKENTELLGETYTMLGFISFISSFTDRKFEFVEWFQKADAYLPDGSKLFHNDYHLNKGTYACMVHAMHYEKGSVDKLLNAMSAATPCASKVMNGCGYGIQYLTQTEAAYYRKDYKNAQKYAQQAIYASQQQNQYDIENMAIFYLMRTHIALCNYVEVVELLERIKQIAEKFPNADCYGMLHIVQGWFYTVVGQPQLIEPWIMDKADDYKEVSNVAFCLHRLVRARSYLVQKDYYELLAFLEQNNGQYGLENFLMGAIELKVMKAIALYRLNEKAEAFAVLEKAYALAEPNGLIMPFIEQGNAMRTLANAAMNDESTVIPAQWLQDISFKASTYAKKVKYIVVAHRQTQGEQEVPEMTTREKQVLSYLCHGLTQKEIADECDLSVNTIKIVLQNIYKKLGAFNSYNAVAIATKLNLNL